MPEASCRPSEVLHMTFPQTRSSSFLSDCLVSFRRSPAIIAFAGAATLVAATAIANQQLAKKAQLDNPPRGHFLDLDGVRLHYVERGNGRPLVLFHGNGSMIQDFESSGLIHLAAAKYRVIVFDRPGFGHSLRPRNVVWTPEAQADLFKKALDRLSVQRAIVLGHSWGASVAVALAIRHPSLVEALVLASGYYFPTARADVAASSVTAIPGLGDIVSYTISRRDAAAFQSADVLSRQSVSTGRPGGPLRGKLDHTAGGARFRIAAYSATRCASPRAS